MASAASDILFYFNQIVPPGRDSISRQCHRGCCSSIARSRPLINHGCINIVLVTAQAGSARLAFLLVTILAQVFLRVFPDQDRFTYSPEVSPEQYLTAASSYTRNALPEGASVFG